MSRPVIVIVGAGPGVSGSVARRFARDGYDVGLIGVDEAQLGELTIDLESVGAGVSHVVADITDRDAATAAVAGLGSGSAGSTSSTSTRAPSARRTR